MNALKIANPIPIDNCREDSVDISPNVSSLPVEIWCGIFSYLSFKELATTALVCRNLYKMTLSDTPIKISQLKTYFPDIQFIDEELLEEQLSLSKQGIHMEGVPSLHKRQFFREISKLRATGILDSQIVVMTTLKGLSFELLFRSIEQSRQGIEARIISVPEADFSKQKTSESSRSILVTSAKNENKKEKVSELENYHIADPLATTMLAILNSQNADRQFIKAPSVDWSVNAQAIDRQKVVIVKINQVFMAAGLGVLQKTLADQSQAT